MWKRKLKPNETKNTTPKSAGRPNGTTQIPLNQSNEDQFEINNYFEGVSPIKELDPTSNQKIFEYS